MRSVPARPALLLLGAILAAPPSGSPAGAQSLRTVVVPGEAGVVVAPRSASPRLAARPPGTMMPMLDERGSAGNWPGAGAGFGTGLGPVGTGLAVVLPLAAAALLGAGVAGGNNGSTSGPARTR